jgi:hypothetical protein
MVPGSTFIYGSNFCITTVKPLALSNVPKLAAVRPLPNADATPPVTKRWTVLPESDGFTGFNSI